MTALVLGCRYEPLTAQGRLDKSLERNCPAWASYKPMATAPKDGTVVQICHASELGNSWEDEYFYDVGSQRWIDPDDVHLGLMADDEIMANGISAAAHARWRQARPKDPDVLPAVCADGKCIAPPLVPLTIQLSIHWASP